MIKAKGRYMKIYVISVLAIAAVPYLLGSPYKTESQRHLAYLKKNLLDNTLSVFNVNQHLVKPMLSGTADREALGKLVSPHKERILARGQKMLKRNNSTIHYRDLDSVLAEILLLELVSEKDSNIRDKAKALINKLVEEKILILAEEFAKKIEQKKNLTARAGIDDLDGVVHKLNLTRFAFSGIDEELGDRANLLAKKIHALVKKPY